jgi:hypothetical protein
LKLTDRDRAIAALDSLRREKGKSATDLVEPPLSTYAIDLDGAPLTYGAVRKRLVRFPKGRPGTGQSLNKIAAQLLKTTVEMITTEQEPSDEEITPDPKAEPRENDIRPQDLLASVPTIVTDHRAVIVGILPESKVKLYPAVLVRPHDGNPYWYPQIAGKHNPIQVDRAFACLAHFGNPGPIRFPRPVALHFDVKVFALRCPWEWKQSDQIDRLDDDGLKRRLKDLQPVCHKLYEVRREIASLKQITLADGSGKRVQLGPTKMIECVAPVTISWRGPHAYVEVRRGRDDHRELCDEAASSVKIMIGDTSAPGVPGRCVVSRAGHYRVRLHPEKMGFIDPPFEWYLNLKANPGRSSRKSKARSKKRFPRSASGLRRAGGG